MKKLFIICLLIACLTPAGAVFAYPFCGPSQPPNQPSAFCRYDLVANDFYRVQTGVSFVWLRNAPSSAAGIVATVQPGAGASLVTIGGVAHWDGVQWWYEMATYPDRRLTGWVERVSLAQVVLQPAPQPLPLTPTPLPGNPDPSIQIQANWQTPLAARVETGTPFLWLRQGPNSGGIVYTLAANSAFRVVGPAAFDGYQWWWLVQAGRAGTVGWVEQGSITPVG